MGRPRRTVRRHGVLTNTTTPQGPAPRGRLMAELATHCRQCGQRLLLRAEGRDICERCRLECRGGSAPVEVLAV